MNQLQRLDKYPCKNVFKYVYEWNHSKKTGRKKKLAVKKKRIRLDWGGRLPSKVRKLPE